MRKVAIAAMAAVLAGCSGGTKAPATEERVQKKAEQAPERYQAKFETTKGDFVIEVVRGWAPRGADRFHELVQDGFFDGSRFFRVRPNFIVQFGISKDPKLSELWRQLRMPDDPVTQKNQRGYVSYAKAGPGSRTTQVFINLADNSRQLDGDGFAPFGRVVEGMGVVDSLYASYGEMAPMGGGPDPQRIEAQGEAYLERMYPRLDKINRASVSSEAQP